LCANNGLVVQPGGLLLSSLLLHPIAAGTAIRWAGGDNPNETVLLVAVLEVCRKVVFQTFLVGREGHNACLHIMCQHSADLKLNLCVLLKAVEQETRLRPGTQRWCTSGLSPFKSLAVANGLPHIYAVSLHGKLPAMLCMGGILLCASNFRTYPHSSHMRSDYVVVAM
jgi:hypothetical protein